jgi:hypothetical protein
VNVRLNVTFLHDFFMFKNIYVIDPILSIMFS